VVWSNTLEAADEVRMSIREEMAAELKDAMRAGDKPRVNVIRQVESEVTLARTAKGFTGEVDDDLYVRVLRSYINKMDKARAEYEAVGERGRANAEKLAYEIEYLSRWVPEQLSEDDTRALVLGTIAELGADDPKQAGWVIGTIMKSGAAVDGSLVNRMVREELGG
jgi:uncharacterized protein YqeY